MNDAELKISLLGGATITRDGRRITGFASRKVDALFIYLACNQRPHPRATLATLLWPNNDQNRALANLSVALSSLRKQLDTYIIADRHTVSFVAGVNYTLDTEQFERAVTQARSQQHRRAAIDRAAAARLTHAISDYKGDFLAGFTIRGAPDFEAWALIEQERLRIQFLDALTDLIGFHQQRRQFTDGIRYAQHLLAVDPLQEDAHRRLMTMFAKNDQRSAALAQYEQCVAVLADELGVEPEDETEVLYQQIRDNTLRPYSVPTKQRAATAPNHNLPTNTTSFIGRKVELARIAAWVAEPDNRLLTILGPGGIGKSRLALEAIRAQVGSFIDGVWFVSLAPQTSFDGLLTAVAKAVALPVSDNSNLRQALLSHLQNKEMLLLLDNIEHLLDENCRTFISDLVRNAANLKLLITSRERLNLQAESLLTMHGLPYPAAGDKTRSLADFAAVQLFVSRARQLRIDFDIADVESAVMQLCQLVDGMPLALELAATWIRVLSLPEIVAEIQRNQAILSTTMGDLPARHRSVQSVFDYTWALLNSAEQAAYTKLAIFRGGFTRACGTKRGTCRFVFAHQSGRQIAATSRSGVGHTITLSSSSPAIAIRNRETRFLSSTS